MIADSGDTGRGDRPLPDSIETAMPVESVEQEYQWLAAHTCVCGYWGQLRVQRQVLIEGDDGRHYDLLETKCTACGKEYSFYFDVTKLFEEYARLLRPEAGDNTEAKP